MTNANDLVNPSVSANGYVIKQGLTKREYFAAMAMQGFIAAWGNHDVTDVNDIAHDAVLAADALIRALN